MKILLVGDIPCQHLLLKSINKYQYSFDDVFSDMKSLFIQYDYVIGNFEGCINGGTRAFVNNIHNPIFNVRATHKKDIRFFSPESFLNAMINSGINIIALANNHIMDGGEKGFQTTYDILKNKEIITTGLYKDEKEYLEKTPIIIYKNDIRIAIINFTTVYKELMSESKWIVPKFIEDDIDRQITKAKDCNTIIAYIHWGNDYYKPLSRNQLKIEKYLREKGVNIIAGCHSHIPQEYKKYDNGITCWSLGNLLCASKKNIIEFIPETKQSIMLSLNIDKNENKIDILKTETIKENNKYKIILKTDEQ